MGTTWKEYDLDNVVIEEISDQLQTYMKEIGEESRSVQRSRLMIEELLLRIRDAYDTPVHISVMIGKRYGRHVFKVTYQGAAFDPIASEDEDNVILETLGLAPNWEYRKGVNTISLTISGRAKHGRLFYILFAILAAALFGGLGALLPDGARTVVDESFVSPLMSCYLGLLSTFAGIMIALTISSGVLGVGDSSALSRIGKLVIIRFVILSLLTSVLALLAAYPFFSLITGGAAQGVSFKLKDIMEMIFDIIPSNPIDPFLKGNSLQIIVIGIFVGVGILAIGERVKTLRSFVLEGTSLFQWLTSSVCSLVSGFVFLALLHQIWGGEVSVLLSVWRPLLIVTAVSIVLAVLCLLVVSLYLRCSPVKVLKKILPPFIVGLTTGSSLSAFTLGMEACQKGFGADESYVRFSYPMGNVMYMQGTVTYLTIVSLFFAETYHVEVSLMWFITVVITSTLLAIAVPPIPGAGLMLFSILFLELGIPMEGLAMAAAMDIVIDFLDTGLNLFHLILEIAAGSKSMKKMN